MPPRINIPPVTRVLLVILIAQSALGAAIRYRQWSETASIVIPYLTLIPQLSLVYPWTLVTTTLVESNIFTLAIACFTLYQGGRYLERAWSSADLAKFILVVSLVPNILTFGTMVFFFTLTRNERWTCVIPACLFSPSPANRATVSARLPAPFRCKSHSSSPLASSCPPIPLLSSAASSPCA